MSETSADKGPGPAVEYAISLTREVCALPKWRSLSDRWLREWVKWANGWLSGRDRSALSAAMAVGLAVAAFQELKDHPDACGYEDIRLAFVASAVVAAAVSAAQAASVLAASNEALVSRLEAAASTSEKEAARIMIEQIVQIDAEADRRVQEAVAKAVGAAKFAMGQSNSMA